LCVAVFGYDAPDDAESLLVVVGQPALGVEADGCEVEALSDVRRTEARSAEIERCEGVTLSFHVSVYSVEPSKAVWARNLLSNEARRAALANEAERIGPEVTSVISSFAATSRAEGLTGAGGAPNRKLVWISGHAERVTPDRDSSEEVDLSAAELVRLNFRDAALNDFSWGNVARCCEVANPLRRIGLNLVVCGAHAALRTGAPRLSGHLCATTRDRDSNTSSRVARDTQTSPASSPRWKRTPR